MRDLTISKQAFEFVMIGPRFSGLCGDRQDLSGLTSNINTVDLMLLMQVLTKHLGKSASRRAFSKSV